MSRKNTSSKSDKPPDKTTIYVALIGLIGTIIVAIIGMINTRSQILLPVSLTQTAESNLAFPPPTTLTALPTADSVLSDTPTAEVSVISITGYNSSFEGTGEDGQVVCGHTLYILNSSQREIEITNFSVKVSVQDQEVKLDSFQLPNKDGQVAWNIQNSKNLSGLGTFNFTFTPLPLRVGANSSELLKENYEGEHLQFPIKINNVWSQLYGRAWFQVLSNASSLVPFDPTAQNISQGFSSVEITYIFHLSSYEDVVSPKILCFGIKP
jgi:hypothetical protein